MRIRIHVALIFLLGVGVAAPSTPSRAETGSVAVLFTKGGFILGAGAGEGVLTLRGKHYPFTVSGMSVGFTIGASTTRLVGRALNLRGPASIEGATAPLGAGGAHRRWRRRGSIAEHQWRDLAAQRPRRSGSNFRRPLAGVSDLLEVDREAIRTREGAAATLTRAAAHVLFASLFRFGVICDDPSRLAVGA